MLWYLETLLTKQKSTLQGTIERKAIFILKSLLFLPYSECKGILTYGQRYKETKTISSQQQTMLLNTSSSSQLHVIITLTNQLHTIRREHLCSESTTPNSGNRPSGGKRLLSSNQWLKQVTKDQCEIVSSNLCFLLLLWKAILILFLLKMNLSFDMNENSNSYKKKGINSLIHSSSPPSWSLIYRHLKGKTSRMAINQILLLEITLSTILSTLGNHI